MLKHPAFEFIKKHVFFFLGGACLVAIGAVYIVWQGSAAKVVRQEDVIFDSSYEGEEYEPPHGNSILYVPEPEPENLYMIVHIAGAVNNPGVFELREGARVNDALELAGGPLPDADLTRVNLAAFLRDAMQIIIPAVGEDIEEVFIYEYEEPYDAQQGGGPVNINTATLAELQTLPGIGPVIAQNIIDFRNAHGRFSSAEELLHVPRIGQATLDRFRDMVTVD